MPQDGVVYLDLRWSCLPSLLRHAGRRSSSWSLHSSLGPRSERLIRRVFGVRPIDISLPDEFVIVPGSSESAMRRAIAALDAHPVGPLLAAMAAELPGTPEAARALHSALLRPVGERSLDAFYVECWASSQGWRRTTVIAARSWDVLLLDAPERGIRVRGRASRAIASGVDVTALAFRRLFPRLRAIVEIRVTHARRHPRRHAAAADPTRHVPPVGPTGAAARRARIALAFNHGRTYSDLYTYDHVLSGDTDSPLHADAVLHISMDGGPAHPDGVPHRYPGVGGLRVLATAAMLAARTMISTRGAYPLTWVAHLSWTIATARAQALVLRTSYPELRVAVVAYEVQLPIALTLAMQEAGIRTIAFNERPLTSMVESQPVVLDTLMTAGPAFAERVLSSRSITATAAPATGMWRTDLLLDCRRSTDPSPWLPGHTRVLALPYHVDERPGFGKNPLAMSPPAVRQFLEDCLELAAARPGIHLIIRGKHDRWLRFPPFADLVDAVSRMPNVDVHRDYATMQGSYRLAAGADLVVAQYTSLADEALAVGIPCVLHDYLPNSRGYGRGIATHLPDMLWALDPEGWRLRTRAIIDDDGAAFALEWEPYRQSLYGGLADGGVRERARRLVLDLLAGNQAHAPSTGGSDALSR